MLIIQILEVIVSTMAFTSQKIYSGFCTIEGYGGDKNGKPTVMFRNVCLQGKKPKSGKRRVNILFTDHQWVKGNDTQKVLDLTKSNPQVKCYRESESNAGRPKRGTKVFITGKLEVYLDKQTGCKKLKFVDLERVEARAYDDEGHQEKYWFKGDPIDKTFWHGEKK